MVFLKISVVSALVNDVYEDEIFVIHGDEVDTARAVGESSLPK